MVYTSINNCPSTPTKGIITVTEKPTLQLADIDVCEGKSGNLVATASQLGGFFTWSPSGGNGNTLTINPTASTIVSVYYNLFGCLSQTETANVKLIKTPTVSVSNIGICKGSSGTLLAIPSDLGGSFAWSTSETTPTISVQPNVTTQYNVVYTLNGCSSAITQATVMVDSIPKVTFDADVTEGCSPLTVKFTNTSKNTQNCTWDFGNGLQINECNTLSFTFQQAGCYDISLSSISPNGCSASMLRDDMICVHPKPVSNFTISTDIVGVTNNTVYLQNISENAVNYIWNYGDSKIDSTLLNPESHTYKNVLASEFVISLIAISEFGCIDSSFKIIRTSNEIVLYAPNTFIPDDDGLNDSWYPVISAGYYIEDYKLSIYNRWGETIFATEDLKQGWDGTYKGNAVQDGTYTYKIMFRDKRKFQQMQIGHINLIR